MAELTWDRALAALLFVSSCSFLVVAYAIWQRPESMWPLHFTPEVHVAFAIVFLLTGVLVIVYGRWKRRQQDAF